MTLAEMEKILAQLQFIHQRLTQTSQYFVGEFDVAKDAITLVTNQFNELKKKYDDEAAAERLKAKEEPEVKEN